MIEQLHLGALTLLPPSWAAPATWRPPSSAAWPANLNSAADWAFVDARKGIDAKMTQFCLILKQRTLFDQLYSGALRHPSLSWEHGRCWQRYFTNGSSMSGT